MTTLRQRMIDAMVLRGFRPRTQVSYLRAVSQMARYYHRSPELITDQEVQAYLLHLVRDRQLARPGHSAGERALALLANLPKVDGKRAPKAPPSSPPRPSPLH